MTTTKPITEALEEIFQRVDTPPPDPADIDDQAILLLILAGRVAVAVDRYRRLGYKSVLTEELHNMAASCARTYRRLGADRTDTAYMIKEAAINANDFYELPITLIWLTEHTTATAKHMNAGDDDYDIRRGLLDVIGSCAGMLASLKAGN